MNLIPYALRAYVTLLGRSVWALLNTYYAVLREGRYLPDEVWVITEETYRGKMGAVEEGVGIISGGFHLEPNIQADIVADSDFLEAGKRISELIKGLKAEGHEVALDITPGRKALVAGALLSTARIDLDHVFYLLIDTLEGAARPYPMIPLQFQYLRDFMEDTGVHGP